MVTERARAPHRWDLMRRFRRQALGWRSQPAILRIREAVTEIRRAARHDPVLGAEGAVTLLERLSPALEEVDSSSEAIGAAVNRAIDAPVPIIAGAPAAAATRAEWPHRQWAVRARAALGRKFEAVQLAEASRGPWTRAGAVDRVCEQIRLGPEAGL